MLLTHELGVPLGKHVPPVFSASYLVLGKVAHAQKWLDCIGMLFDDEQLPEHRQLS